MNLYKKYFIFFLLIINKEKQFNLKIYNKYIPLDKTRVKEINKNSIVNMSDHSFNNPFALKNVFIDEKASDNWTIFKQRVHKFLLLLKIITLHI